MKEKSYDELDFTDDFLFCKIMMENEDLCIEMAEMITGRQIKILVCSEDQKTIRLTRNGKGRHKYSFENICLEDAEIKLEDGSHKIFLCAAGTMDDCSERMKDFLDYIAGGTESGALSDRLRTEVEKSKANEKWRLDYMTLEEKYREKYEEGKTDLLVRKVCKKLRKGKSIPQIADELEEDEIRIRAICQEAEKYAPDYDEEKVLDAVQATFV